MVGGNCVGRFYISLYFLGVVHDNLGPKEIIRSMVGRWGSKKTKRFRSITFCWHYILYFKLCHVFSIDSGISNVNNSRDPVLLKSFVSRISDCIPCAKSAEVKFFSLGSFIWCVRKIFRKTNILVFWKILRTN